MRNILFIILVFFDANTLFAQGGGCNLVGTKWIVENVVLTRWGGSIVDSLKKRQLKARLMAGAAVVGLFKTFTIFAATLGSAFPKLPSWPTISLAKLLDNPTPAPISSYRFYCSCRVAAGLQRITPINMSY